MSTPAPIPTAPVENFARAIADAGIEPPDEIIADGGVHRFATNGKRGDDAGWYVLHSDGIPAGAFGDWRSDVTKTWCARRIESLSPAEREEHRRRIEAARCEAEAERARVQKEVAKRAAELWARAKPETGEHRYLRDKRVQAHGIRTDGERLLIPMRDAEGKPWNIQRVAPDGTKRFLPGGRTKGLYFGIGRPDGVLVIAEGFATAASIREATGHAVAVAFSAANLPAVAEALRKKLGPDVRLIIAGDNDVSGIGQKAATEAACAIGGRMAIPKTPGSDWNDVAQAEGSEAVRKGIGEARVPESMPTKALKAESASEWLDPQPLTTKVDPEPYPADALPDAIRAAVAEVQGFTKAPVALVASSALSALSLAIQAYVDAKRAERLIGPVSLFLLTIADSGERKTTVDRYFTSAIHDYENKQAESAKLNLADYKAAVEAWDAKQSGIKDKIRMLSRKRQSTADMETDLQELQQHKPKPPCVPRLLYTDATPEALAYNLAKGWPSGGVVSAEAGIVFGAHGMGKDSIMRNLALLNMLWDGGNLTIDRRTSESFTVRGARLTVALQVQEAILHDFFDRSGRLARGSGFLSRFLLSWPESTQGYRPFTDAPVNWPALAAFNRRITAILEQPASINENGALTPAMLLLSVDAKKAWVAFHDAIERELTSGGELYDVRDVASKTADNAARLAALFHTFEHGISGVVGLGAFEGASRIVAWHLNEARRFFGELALPVELADAARLDGWLIDYCRRQRTNIIPRREVQRNVVPVRLRQKAALNSAMDELSEGGRIRSVKDGSRREIHVNPALLEGGAA
jgi:putative DNA primase/helicase